MVEGVEGKAEKVSELKRHLTPVIGRKLLRFETALIKHEDGKWGDWFDLPVRLFFEQNTPVSISWSHFDSLFISKGFSLPFDLKGIEVAWQDDRLGDLSILTGKTLGRAFLGTGEMTWGEQELEVWTRLVLEFEVGFLEIFNGLDENAFSFHTSFPDGTFEKIC